MSAYAVELHTAYETCINAFLAAYPYASENTSLLVDRYCRNCAIYLWSSASIPAKICLDAINAIYTGAENKKTYTLAQVKEASAKWIAHHAPPAVPAFFNEAAEHDRQDHTNISCRFIDCLSLILASFALLDGSPHEEYRKSRDSILLPLLDKCRQSGCAYYSYAYLTGDMIAGTDPLIPDVSAPSYLARMTREKEEDHA